MSVGFIPARIFLSTPSARRATRRHRPARRLQYDFYPRPPRGGRHWIKLKDSFMNSISIHALREEGDAVSGWATRLLLNFYPRPPRGGRRGIIQRQSCFQIISIHALREEGDPRMCEVGNIKKISIHALREEGDAWKDGRIQIHVYFYPRPPRGGRHAGPARLIDLLGISIHALREEGDRFIAPEED